MKRRRRALSHRKTQTLYNALCCFAVLRRTNPRGRPRNLLTLYRSSDKSELSNHTCPNSQQCLWLHCCTLRCTSRQQTECIDQCAQNRTSSILHLQHIRFEWYRCMHGSLTLTLLPLSPLALESGMKRQPELTSTEFDRHGRLRYLSSQNMTVAACVGIAVAVSIGKPTARRILEGIS